MNDYAHQLFGALPAVAWVGMLSAVIIGAVVPWIAERAAPGHWDDGMLRLGMYGVAILLGPPAALSFWQTPAALTLGFVGGLAAQVLREWAATRWTWLSPRIIRKRNAQGEEGFKVYNPDTKSYDATVYTKADPTVPRDKP